MRPRLWSTPLPTGPVPDGRSLRVALVSCGKAKVEHPAPAREFYTGSLFRAARAHVEAQSYDAWWILSARHYLVHPDDILAPYEAALTNAPDEYLPQWAHQVDASFRCNRPGYGVWTQNGGDLTVDIFAGKVYVDPLMALPAKWQDMWTVNEPHHGMQIGERLQAFAQARETAA